MRRLLAVLFGLVVIGGLFGVSCGGGTSTSQSTAVPTSSTGADLTPIPGNSELVVGPNRFAVALIDKQTNPVLGTNGNSVHLLFSGPDGKLKSEQDAHFVWAIPDTTGFWAADITFDTAGQWTGDAAVIYGGKKINASFVFTVLAKGQAPAVGHPAPPTDNLTFGANTNTKQVTTDARPNAAFYQMTVTQALSAKKPFVVVFATPAFCKTRFCGPMLDNVKAVQATFAGRVNFIHIEPYKLDTDGGLVTDDQGSPIAATPTDQWHLQTEPWVFVVGADGRISARFEGAASPEELRAAIQSVAGG